MPTEKKISLEPIRNEMIYDMDFADVETSKEQKESIARALAYLGWVKSDLDTIHKTGENMESQSKDNINHPSHYTSGKIEVIDFIDDQKLNYERGNAIKYICRAGRKDPEKEIEDLKKAIWYLNREIHNLENK